MQGEGGIRARFGADGIVSVSIDIPGRKPNLITSSALREIEQVVGDLAGSGDARGIIFLSPRPDCFVSGSDPAEYTDVEEAFRAAEQARYGQEVFRKVADLDIPTACAISGTCLGPGTELALACTFRIASDRSGTRIGLLEVKSGRLPAHGGTQRLPRLIGLNRALDMICEGRAVDGERALSCKLVDMLVPEAVIVDEASRLLRMAYKDRAAALASVGRRSQAWRRPLEKVRSYRRMIISRMHRRLSEKMDPTAYPAPFKALEALEASFAMPLPQGLDLEARLIGELAPSRTARNLIRLQQSRDDLRGVGPGIRVLPRKVGRAAVIGAGRLGGGVARLFAGRELPVRLIDRRLDALLEEMGKANDQWQQAVRDGMMPKDRPDWLMGYISPSTGFSGLGRADLVLEAISENLEAKRGILAEAETRMTSRAVYAINTAAIPIDSISSGCLHPERVVGLHFFNPVGRMNLVEIVAGHRSSPEALATARATALKLGKTPVQIKDSTGFLVNRVLMSYLLEALRLLREGVRIEAIDSAMRSFGMPDGPFSFMDNAGLEAVEFACSLMARNLGDRFLGPSDILQTLVSAGKTGSAAGEGFYRYRGGTKTVPDKETYNLAGIGKTVSLPPEMLQERMALAMANEAGRALEQELVASPAALDLAMVLGAGFPPYRGGLLRYMDTLGIQMTVDRLSRLAETHGDRYEPCSLLSDMALSQERFYSTG